MYDFSKSLPEASTNDRVKRGLLGSFDASSAGGWYVGNNASADDEKISSFRTQCLNYMNIAKEETRKKIERKSKRARQ